MHIKILMERGLSKKEANRFMELLHVMIPTKEDTDNFYKEMEEAIPFEGGMGFTEALTGLVESL